MSEQYPDVKVIGIHAHERSLVPLSLSHQERLEDQAFYAFYKRLAESNSLWRRRELLAAMQNQQAPVLRMGMNTS